MNRQESSQQMSPRRSRVARPFVQPPTWVRMLAALMLAWLPISNPTRAEFSVPAVVGKTASFLMDVARWRVCVDYSIPPNFIVYDETFEGGQTLLRRSSEYLITSHVRFNSPGQPPGFVPPVEYHPWVLGPWDLPPYKWGIAYVGGRTSVRGEKYLVTVQVASTAFGTPFGKRPEARVVVLMPIIWENPSWSSRVGARSDPPQDFHIKVPPGDHLTLSFGENDDNDHSCFKIAFKTETTEGVVTGWLRDSNSRDKYPRIEWIIGAK